MIKHVSLFTALLLIVLLAIPVQAQTATPTPPDYFVSLRETNLSSDGIEGYVTIVVRNNGGAATRTVTANLLDLGNANRIIASQPVPPLTTGEQTELTLTFSTSLFTPGAIQLLRVEVGIDEIETAQSGTLSNNFVPISIRIPERAIPAPSAATPTPPAGEIAPTAPLVSESPAKSDVQSILDGMLQRWGLDPASPRQSALVAAGATLIALFVVLLLLLVRTILRLLLERSPAFGAWQTPYAGLPQQDTNTIAGRRQLWQQYAANNLIDAPTVANSVHARKLLLGMNDQLFSGWRIVSVRLTQYDMYGRIARTQQLATSSLLRGINRLIRRRSRLGDWRLRRQSRRIARLLVKPFASRLNKRNAMLPVALDLRFRGMHGEVRIQFELYQVAEHTWRQIDRWEPEMAVMSKTIYESYTYPMYGQRSDESLRAFRRRLRENTADVLVKMLRWEPAMPAPGAPAETPPTEPGLPVVPG